jgi:hypothetical protein
MIEIFASMFDGFQNHHRHLSNKAKMCRPKRLSLVGVAALVCLCALTGCKDSKNPTVVPTSDQSQVTQLVGNMGDYAKNLRMLKTLFTDDNKLTEEDRKNYYEFTAIVDQPVRIQKDTAIIPVKLKDSKGKEVGRKDWTAVKQGDDWKLKSAPLN